MTISQTDFDKETGLPRWGCMFMSLVVGAWRAANDKDPTHDDVMRVYTDCRQSVTPKWVDGVQVGVVPVLEMTDHTTYEIYVNNPTAVLTTALSYTNNGWRGCQYPDLNTRVPTHRPRDYRLTYTLLNFRRPSSDGHWVLGDRSGMNVLYNPDESLDIDWWSRSPAWRGIKVYMV